MGVFRSGLYCIACCEDALNPFHGTFLNIARHTSTCKLDCCTAMGTCVCLSTADKNHNSSDVRLYVAGMHSHVRPLKQEAHLVSSFSLCKAVDVPMGCVVADHQHNGKLPLALSFPGTFPTCILFVIPPVAPLSFSCMMMPPAYMVPAIREGAEFSGAHPWSK